MLIQPYSEDELIFAYCYRVYLRWRTHRSRAIADLPKVIECDVKGIAERYRLHVLEQQASTTDVMLLLSLEPEAMIAASASQLKGQLSKRLAERRSTPVSDILFSRGYFAVTAGESLASAVNAYLEKQGAHHGYAERVVPSVFNFTGQVEGAFVNAKHSFTMLRLHIVLATWRRHGVFLPDASEAVAEQWRILLRNEKASLLKTAFLPDHVHLAVRIHPSVSPASMIVKLMNESQKLIWERFSELAIRGKVERLWQPSAYLGSFGDLASPQITRYMRDWKGSLQ